MSIRFNKFHLNMPNKRKKYLLNQVIIKNNNISFLYFLKVE